ncbi:MAG: IPT/TIG domain-containing protein [Planctomycetes bacterium]|nr:IPT/TIG domain-containing protein [Planctomycetota bacterium]
MSLKWQTPVATICTFFLLAQGAFGAGPVITRIEPREVRIGQSIKVTGHNLQATRSVHFLIGSIKRAARFRAVSNTELQVIVPECYLADAEASILIQQPDGVAVTCPISEVVVRDSTDPDVEIVRSFYHVLSGGILSSASSTTLIEDGGVVESVEHMCPVVLVRNGGTLTDAEDASGLNGTRILLHEPNARLGPGLQKPRRDWSIVPVPGITVAEGVGPLRYGLPPVDGKLLKATQVPEITSISPTNAAFGDVLTLKGRGFSGTEDVYLINDVAERASFRIISDEELKLEAPGRFAMSTSYNDGTQEKPAVEMPDHAVVAVYNSAGLTITRSPTVPGATASQPVFQLMNPKIGSFDSLEQLQDAVAGSKTDGLTVEEAIGSMTTVDDAASFSKPVKKLQISKLTAALRFTRSNAGPNGK